MKTAVLTLMLLLSGLVAGSLIHATPVPQKPGESANICITAGEIRGNATVFKNICTLNVTVFIVNPQDYGSPRILHPNEEDELENIIGPFRVTACYTPEVPHSMFDKIVYPHYNDSSFKCRADTA